MKAITLTGKTLFSILCINILVGLCAITSTAQVSLYTFSQASDVYTPIAGGAQVAVATGTSGATSLDDVNYTAGGTTVPFTFNFNGTGYTSLIINSNGSITFGATLPSTTNYTPVSSTTTYNGAVAGFARDLRGVYATSCTRTIGSNILNVASPNVTNGVLVGSVISVTGVPTGTTVTAVTPTSITMSANATTAGTSTTTFLTGEIRTQTIGVSPNQTFVIQWKGFQRFGTSNEWLNFQVRLNEAGGIASSQTIDIVYGDCGTTSTSSAAPQVGIRGASNGDFNNRTGTIWASSTAGGSNTASMSFLNTSVPVSGQRYTWTPAVPASCPAPFSLSTTNVSGTSATLNWGCSSCTGTFRVEYAVSPATFGNSSNVVINGANSPVNISGLSLSTTYQWFVRQDCGADGFSTVSTSTFTTSAIANDACADAITINCASGSVSGTTVGANTDVYTNCGAGGTTPQTGVWYKIVGNDNAISITTCNTPGFDTRLTVYQGTCGSLNCVTGNDDMGSACTISSTRSLVSFNAFSGNDYYVFVHGFSGTGAFVLSLTCTPLCLPVPANEVCAAAQPLTVSTSSCVTASGDNHCAAAPSTNPSCFSSFATLPDVWYSFVAGSNPIHKLKITYGTATTLGYALYSGTCGALTQVSCNTNAGSGTEINLGSLTVGATYYVQVLSDIATAGSFDICVMNTVPPPGDICTTAIPISCGPNVSGTTVGTTPDVAPTCVTTDGTGGGVWYTYTGDDNVVTINSCNPGTNFDTKIRVYSGSCGSLTCVTGQDDQGATSCSSTGGSFSSPGLTSKVTWAAFAGTQYYILVHGFGTAEGNYELSVSCSPLAPCAVGTATSNVSVACGPSLNGVLQLSVSSFSGNLQWQEEFPFGSGTWTDISGATANPSAINIPTPGQRRFRAQASGFCLGSAAASNNVEFLLDNPAAPTDATGLEACGSATGTISVTPTTGNEVRWYSVATGGSILGTGSTFNVNVTTTTDYYAASFNPVTSCEGTPRTKVTAKVNPFPVVGLTNSAPVICNPGAAPNSSLLTTNVTNGGAGNSVFVNEGLITIPAGAPSSSSGPASSYPSTILVSGLPASTPVHSVTLSGLAHTFPGDLDIVLVSPTGVPVVLISDVGGSTEIAATNLTLEDGAPAIPTTFPGIEPVDASGTYAPTNSGATDTYDVPGPGSVTQATPTLSSFTGDPNGTWSLYIVDDAGGDIGSMASWTLTFLGGQTFTYNVTPVTGLTGLTSGSVSGSDPVTLTSAPTSNQTYTVNITNASTGCSSTASTSIVVNKAPAIVSLQSATLNSGVAAVFPPLPTFLDIPATTEATTCDKAVNYNVNITGTPNPAESVSGITYTFTGATTGNGIGTGSGSTFGRLIPTGRTTVTVNASNVCGSQSKTFRVTVTDNVAPVITPIPVAATNTNGGECASLVQVTPPTLGNGLFDNCPNASAVFVSRSDGRTQFEPYYAGTTTVTWQATDASANTSTATQSVVVNNFKPVINSLTTTSNVIFVGQSATFTVNFTDEDGGGTHTVKFYRDKNDATPSSTKVLGPACTQSCTGTRNYSATSDPILYTVSEVAEPKVEVLDGCNLAADQNPGVSTYMYLAVAVAGQQFTTAGGHFTMPAGGFPTTYEGFNVSIGNVCKKATTGNSYKGQLEMNVHIPNLPDWRVHTDNGTNTDITWDYLTIGGCSLATFKGAVRLNGQTGYKVLVQQSDKDRNPATSNFIRVKVTTNSGAVVFDTQPGLTEALSSGNGGAAAIITALTGGSIKVQPANGCVSRIEDETAADGLLQNIPNPFTGETEIRFSVPQDGKYTLRVFNYLGQTVETLFDEEALAGSVYSVKFNGNNHDNGIYTYTLTGNNTNESRRMNLIR
jgi:subtilisin-like proprotein convertase family protein